MKELARPRQPISLIEAKGKKHLTKAEKEERKATEVRAKSDNIIPPSYLPEELKDEFYRLAKELLDIDIMSNLDCEALARFIVSEYQYQLLSEKILKTKAINDKYYDLLKAQEKVFKMCRAAASDLGLTISSRAKLVVPKKEEEQKESKWSKFGAGMNG